MRDQTSIDPSPLKPPPRPLPYLLLAALLCVDVSTYLLEKVACTRAGGDGWVLLAGILRQPFFWTSLALGPVQLYLWTTILSRADLSVAYPISGFNMPLTIIAATLFLGEHLPWQVWTGAILITLGGAIIGPGQGGQAHHPPQTPPG